MDPQSSTFLNSELTVKLGNSDKPISIDDSQNENRKHENDFTDEKLNEMNHYADIHVKSTHSLTNESQHSLTHDPLHQIHSNGTHSAFSAPVSISNLSEDNRSINDNLPLTNHISTDLFNTPPLKSDNQLLMKIQPNQSPSTASAIGTGIQDAKSLTSAQSCLPMLPNENTPLTLLPSFNQLLSSVNTLPPVVPSVQTQDNNSLLANAVNEFILSSPSRRRKLDASIYDPHSRRREYNSCHACKVALIPTPNTKNFMKLLNKKPGPQLDFVRCMCGLLYCGRDRCIRLLQIRDWNEFKYELSTGFNCIHCQWVRAVPGVICPNSNCKKKKKARPAAGARAALAGNPAPAQEEKPRKPRKVTRPKGEPRPRKRKLPPDANLLCHPSLAGLGIPQLANPLVQNISPILQSNQDLLKSSNIFNMFPQQMPLLSTNPTLSPIISAENINSDLSVTLASNSTAVAGALQQPANLTQSNTSLNADQNALINQILNSTSNNDVLKNLQGLPPLTMPQSLPILMPTLMSDANKDQRQRQNASTTNTNQTGQAALAQLLQNNQFTNSNLLFQPNSNQQVPCLQLADPIQQLLAPKPLQIVPNLQGNQVNPQNFMNPIGGAQNSATKSSNSGTADTVKNSEAQSTISNLLTPPQQAFPSSDSIARNNSSSSSASSIIAASSTNPFMNLDSDLHSIPSVLSNTNSNFVHDVSQQLMQAKDAIAESGSFNEQQSDFRD